MTQDNKNPDWRRVYVVNRFDQNAWKTARDNADISNYLVTKEVLNTLEEAEKEVARLNNLATAKGDRYHWQSAKYYPQGRNVDTAQVAGPPEEARSLPTSPPSSAEQTVAAVRFTASLRVVGESMDFEWVSQIMGCEPTKVNQAHRVAVWSLEPSAGSPVSLEEQISDLLNQATDELDRWDELTKRYKADVFIGVFSNRAIFGMALSAEILERLGKRGLIVDFDIYSF